MQWQKIENKLRRLSRLYRDSFDEKKVIYAIKNLETGSIDTLVGTLGCPVTFNDA